MWENTECNKQVQGPHYTETSCHNLTNNCKDNYFAPDVPQNITNATLSYVDFTNLIQEIDEIQELSPNFNYNIEDNQNIANCVSKTNDALTANDFDIDAIVKKRFDEIMIENNHQSVPSTEQEHEQLNIDSTIYGEEISKESYTLKEVLADNCRSADTYATEITSTLNDAFIDISEGTKLNYKKASDADDDVGQNEIKKVSLEEVLSEFLNFNKSNNSIEASKDDISNNNVGERKKEKRSLKKDNSIVQKEKVVPTKKYKCDWCDSQFTFKKDATKHFKDIHGLNYTCTICEFSTTSLYKLELHTLRHTGEKPFACNLCNYTSCRQDMLVKHFLTHTNDNKQFVCTTCNSNFKSVSSLKRHIKKYCAVNRCALCLMQFTSAADFVQHIKTTVHNDNEAPYICSLCGLKYKTKYGHSRHLKTHTQNTYEN